LRKTAPAGKEISINYAEEDHPDFEIEDHQNIAPDEALERDEAQKHLHKLINQLPEHYRETLQFHLAGLSNVEIARCKMVQESTVRSRIFRATKMLQERLHKEGE
jgi:RNA polymerase sigma factor (sigma-70 family)